MDVLLSGFADELVKLAADLTPSQPVMTDQHTFSGVGSQTHSPMSVKKMLSTSIGHLATRAGSPPVRTTPPTMQREAL